MKKKNFFKKISICISIILFLMLFIQVYISYSRINITSSNNDIYNTQQDKFTEQKSDSNKKELENNFENLIHNDNLKNKNSIIVDSLKIHFIDVEQGDAIFIELPNKEAMLIDAGENQKGQIVADYIKNLGYSSIDYLIGTHPHSDHIGGLTYIINNFEIKKIYMPKAISTTKTYENLLNAIYQKGLKINTAKANINILNVDNLNVRIIAPNNDTYTELNNYSVVIKITYKEKKFLFMGDAEILSENEINDDVNADVIKIGHHGSDTSSGKSFVQRVSAKYAIITVGNNNKYNHPYQSIIDRWANIGATIYRTDLNGNIIVKSDGNAIEINTEK